MKKILLTALLGLGSFLVHAQTKGTSAMGLGLNFQNSKSEQNLSRSENKNAGFNIGYGYFFQENKKIGVNVFYGMSKSGSALAGEELNFGDWNSSSYAANFTYQQYYPLVKKFYAYAGPRAGYAHDKGSSASQGVYSLGVNGGVSWFFSKRFALEADLLSADINYAISKQSSASNNSKYQSSRFSLNSSGAVNDLAFKIFFLF